MSFNYNFTCIHNSVSTLSELYFETLSKNKFSTTNFCTRIYHDHFDLSHIHIDIFFCIEVDIINMELNSIQEWVLRNTLLTIFLCFP